MLAYDKTTLRNMIIQEEAEEAAHYGLISAEKKIALQLTYPVDLYTPNFFVRIGLGILTIFIVLASLGLLALLTGFNNAGGLLIFSGLVCYGFLEMMTSRKKHYNSGVDNILMISVIIMITSAIMFLLPYTVNDGVVVSLCVFTLAGYFALRFGDGIMAVAAAVSLLFFVFFSISTLGAGARLALPFILIAASGALYFAAVQIGRWKIAFYYQFALKAVAIVALSAIYIAGNYFVVRETSLDMFRFQLNKSGNISMAWFFWLWTMAVPVVYTYVGLTKRDLLFTRLGVVLAAFSVLTFRYYHFILPAETAMILAGALLIAVTYSLIKYLGQPHHGFTFEDTSKKSADTFNLEGVVIGEVFGNKAAPQQQDTTFGGGSFGGAGAGDNY